ncbi:MAG: hypothetical protein IKJ27_09175 [Clostridia bacterium]|nr:hypothetical protein [Clostridia bacterium]
MKLKKKLVLLSLRMILSGFTAECVNALLLRLAFSQRGTPYRALLLLELILCRARLSFKNAEKTYNILFNHHTRGLLPVQ